MQLPETDRYSMDKSRLLSTIAVLFGGRIAEEIFMNQMTTGASNDFERATAIARDIVTRYGMTDELGPMVYAENEGEVFLGRSVTKTTHMSEATMQKVDSEIRRIIDEQYGVARKILEDNRDKVEVMTAALLEWETIDADQIDDIIEGRPPRPRRRRRVRRTRRTRLRPAWPPAATRQPRSEVFRPDLWRITSFAGASSSISSARLSWVSSMSRRTRFPTAASTTIPIPRWRMRAA